MKTKKMRTNTMKAVWPFPDLRPFPKGSHKKAGYWHGPNPRPWDRMEWIPHERFTLEEGPNWQEHSSNADREHTFYSFGYAVCLFRQKPYSYLELHGIDPESEEGKAHLALWMKHRLEGE